MTDNRNRTAGSIRHHFDKYGGSLGANGCVSWSFDKKGVIVIDNEDEELEEDAVMMDAIDAAPPTSSRKRDCFTVYTDPDSINDVAKALEDKGYKFDSAQIEMVPARPTRSSKNPGKTSPTWKKCSTSSRTTTTSRTSGITGT